MKTIQPFADKAAIGLSFLCTLHCLALPLAIVLLPSLAALPLNDEMFHIWMLIIVVPTSLIAFTLGCREHKRYRLFAFGGIGLTLMVLAVVLEEPLLHDLKHGEAIEKFLTLIGAIIIAVGHYLNYRLCQDTECCDCSEHSKQVLG